MDVEIAMRLDAMEQTAIALARVLNESDPLAGRLFVDNLEQLARSRPAEAAVYRRLIDAWKS